MEATIEVTEQNNNIRITNTNSTIVVEDEIQIIVDEVNVRLLQSVDSSKILAVVTAGPQGPQGIQGIQGPAGGLASIEEDSAPNLGGDLMLGGYNLVGQLENPDLILDGGLL